MSTTPEQGEVKQQFPADTGVALRLIGGGGGLNVSLGDYMACIAACSKLLDKEERLVCMEGCRNISSQVISNTDIADVVNQFTKASGKE